MLKILLILLLCTSIYPNTDAYIFFNSHWKISKNTFTALKKDQVLVKSNVESSDKGGPKQSFEMKTMAYHPKACKKVIKKLARFEDYPSMVDFIKSVEYQERFNFLTIKADHTLLPYPMIIHVIMKRPTDVGIHHFKFPTGMFAGLTGTMTIQDKDKRCAVYTEAKWEGKDTKIPDLVIEIFSETLTRIAVKTLIRKTSR